MGLNSLQWVVRIKNGRFLGCWIVGFLWTLDFLVFLALDIGSLTRQSYYLLVKYRFCFAERARQGGEPPKNIDGRLALSELIINHLLNVR
jgi:hypothetical protein